MTYPNNGRPYTGAPVCVPAKTDMVVEEYRPTFGGNDPYIDGSYIQPSGCTPAPARLGTPPPANLDAPPPTDLDSGTGR